MKTISNSVQLFGNLGKDPEIMNFEGGRKKARVSLATSERYKNTKGEWVTDTQWHNLIAWGKQAEIMEQGLKKGSEIGVKGRLSTRHYEDKEGKRRYITEIIVSDVQFPEPGSGMQVSDEPALSSH